MTICKCRDEIEAKLRKNLQTKFPDATNHDAVLQGYAFVVPEHEGGLQSRPYMPARVEAVHPTKSGAYRRKATTQNVFFNYCPFCGVSERVSSADGLRPAWALFATDDPMQIGAQLRTRDGRRTGNAVTFDREERPSGDVAVIVTDIGTSLRLTREEIAELFYPPEWVLDMSTHTGVARLTAEEAA